MGANRTSTRRRLIAGAAGAAAVGAGAVWADRSGEAARVWHHFAGGCAGPDGTVPPAPARVSRRRARAARRRRGARLGGRRRELLVRPPRRRGPVGDARTEFLPLLGREFGLGRPGRAIAGWSMGGYGALLAAERDPGGWSGVAVAAPAIWPAYGDVWVGDAFDGRADFQRHSVFARATALERMPVWIGCGTADPFYENARRLAAALPAAQTRWADGGHDACLWRLVAPHELAFAVSPLSG